MVAHASDVLQRVEEPHELRTFASQVQAGDLREVDLHVARVKLLDFPDQTFDRRLVAAENVEVEQVEENDPERRVDLQRRLEVLHRRHGVLVTAEVGLELPEHVVGVRDVGSVP